MTFTLWEPIAPPASLEDVLDTSVLFHGDDPARGVVASFTIDELHMVVMRFARTPDLNVSNVLSFRAGTPLSTVGARFFPRAGLRVVAIPPVIWRHRSGGARGRTPAVAVGGTISFVLLLVLNTAWAAALAIPVAVAVATALWFLMRGGEPTRIQTPGALELDGSNVVEYALERQAGQRPEMMRESGRRSHAIQRVAAIRTEFAELQSDIVYRINNSALFDSAVPATERFQMTLIAWEDAGEVPLDELDSLATDVEIAYSVARNNAETLGLFHLPETARSDGRRAAKAARLAVSSPNHGEREASRHQLIRILNSLALYWLPDVKEATKAIEGTRIEDKSARTNHVE